MSNNSNGNKGNAGVMNAILMAILLVFIMLKIVGIISWSWWIVLIPLWIILAIFIFNIVIVMLAGLF